MRFIDAMGVSRFRLPDTVLTMNHRDAPPPPRRPNDVTTALRIVRRELDQQEGAKARREKFWDDQARAKGSRR